MMAARMGVKRKWHGLRLLVGLILGTVVTLMLATRMTRTPKLDENDFCNYATEPYGVPEVYPFNKYQRPVIDFENKLYICVTPKSGITKIQTEFREFVKRRTGRMQPHKFVDGETEKFEKMYGKVQTSLPNSNFTKIFVYRNPVDRMISLYLDKFDSKRVREAWVSQMFVSHFHVLDFDLLMRNLEHYTKKGYQDPHIWPQLDYCSVNSVNYDYHVDIDDKPALYRLFSRYWGDKVDFGSLTRHATKNRVKDDQKTVLRDKIHLWRDHFMRVYGKDVSFYCDKFARSGRPLQERTA